MDEDWDSYFARVDDAPASIYLDLALLPYAQTASEDTLYVIQIAMLEPGEHGMGSASEAASLRPVQDAIVSAARGRGARFVGRLRNRRVWQLTFMGPPGRVEAFRRIAEEHVFPGGRSFDLYVQDDPDWSYYREFLYPNEERLRWILDRRVVDALKEQGDPLTAARQVDHWLYFEALDARASFEEAVTSRGFSTARLSDDQPGSYGLRVSRVDSVQLEEIHEVTTDLAREAKKHSGTYDGWETSVEK